MTTSGIRLYYDMEFDLERKQRNTDLEAFYRKHQKNLVSKMPALDIYDYLVVYDKHKYGRKAENLDYQTLTSPWEYNDGLLDALGGEGKILYNMLPPANPMGQADGRFLTFTAQIDPEKDAHALITAIAIDYSEVGGDPVDIFFKATIFCRNSEDFIKFMDFAKPFIKHAPKKEDTIGGFGGFAESIGN